MADQAVLAEQPTDIEVTQELLDLVTALAEAEGQPVRLASIIRAVELEQLDSRVDFASERLAALCQGLGRRPRRGQLFLLLGDLVDQDKITLSPHGVSLAE